MATVETVFFDMDGLMFDTEKIYFQANAYVLNGMDVAFTEIDYSQLVGTSGQAFVDAMLPFVGDMNGYNYFINEADQYFMNAITTEPVPIKDGLFDLLDYLKEEKVDISVVSSSNRQVVETLLNRSEVIEYISHIVSADDVNHTKPDSEPYLKAVDLSHANIETSWVIEDSNNGILSAKNAGIKAIMVPDMAVANEISKNYAATIVDTLTDVKNYFIEISS